MTVKPNKPEEPRGERLQKILAQAGIASRRKAEEIILEGRVQVNGATVIELGTQLMQAKSGPHGDQVRLYPVGRLDYLSEGLLLMTNDGTLANALSKAAAGVEKTYLVKTSGVPPAEGLEQIRRGIMIDRGRLDEVRAGRRDRILPAPAKVELVRGGDNPWDEVTLTEGNRQLRKMFEEIGHHVEKIRRIGYGALRLDVAPGEFRELKPGEVMALDRAAKGRKVEPKKNLPEFAKLKAPAKAKPSFARKGAKKPGGRSL